MEEIHIKEEPQGTFSCHVGISTQEWQMLLSNCELTTPNYRFALLAFYDAPNHTATCKELSLQYYGESSNAQKFNSWIANYGKAIVKHLNRFQIVDSDGSRRYWHVTMCRGTYTNDGHFETTLRPEIVEAIKKLGWKMNYTWIPFYTEMADKLFSFRDNRKALLDIVYGLSKESVGYIRADDGGHVSDIDPFTVIGIFNRGITDANRIKLCEYFKKKLGIEADVPIEFDGVPVLHNQKSTFFWRDRITTDIQPLWDLFDAIMKGDDTIASKCLDVVFGQKGIKWNITMGMYWVRPYEYISLDSLNRRYLPSIGIEMFEDDEIDAFHYYALLKRVKNRIEKRKISANSIPEISYRAWLSGGEQAVRNYWLVGYSFGGNESQLDRFKEERIWEGGFDEESATDKKLLELAKSIKEGDVVILKSSSTKGKNHDVPFLRVQAVGVVTGKISTQMVDGYTRCRCNVNYVDWNKTDFEGNIYGAYRKTIHQADNKLQEIIDYSSRIINGTPMIQKKYQAYIDLLEENYNLVLTGAPGTGKTFMAQAIADEMGAESMFVQFHPSYDYTDFVEGLRPVEKIDGQMGFERKDGAFKEFCRKAIKNMVDSEKSVENLTKENTWEEKLQQLIDDSIEKGTKFTLATGGAFTIVENRGRGVIVHNEQNEKTTQVLVNTDEILELLVQEVPLNNVKDIRNHFNRRFGTQPDSYAYIITKSVRAMKQKTVTADAAKVLRKPYVFIIDEINRGEASKIFGELFYAIDPGYRGKKEHLVQTQYQNLIPETDVFAKGFYVPENVYILATMNDIDRSVESMDFAMRRRFTWKEVTPEDTEAMLDALPCADEAKAAMKRLNEAITATDGLGAAYSIGPSYFLKLGENGGDFKKLWTMNIEPLLKEYLRGFRKTKEILEKFSKAYSDVKEATQELIDEN